MSRSDCQYPADAIHLPSISHPLVVPTNDNAETPQSDCQYIFDAIYLPFQHFSHNNAKISPSNCHFIANPIFYLLLHHRLVRLHVDIMMTLPFRRQFTNNDVSLLKPFDGHRGLRAGKDLGESDFSLFVNK